MKKPTTFSDQAWQDNKKSISKVQRDYKSLSERQRDNVKAMQSLTQKMTEDSRRTKLEDEKLRGGRKSLNELTTSDYIEKVLANVQHGLTIAVILERIIARGWTTTNPSASYTTVAGALRRDRHKFKKTGPGQFMLLKVYLKIR